MTKKAIILLFVVLFMTGCQGNIQSSAPTPPTVEKGSSNAHEQATAPPSHEADSAPAVANPLSDEQKITQRLIKQGKQALKAKRLLTPEDDNANLYFQAALGRDPGNFTAIEGIAAIVDLYTQWAWQAAKSHHYGTAQRYLDLARSVNSEDTLIVDMASRIKDLQVKRAQKRKLAEQKKPEEADKEGQYRLPKALFSLSDDEIIAKIQPIIESVAQTQDSLAIYWPNDKEARLIYQIINSRVPEFRVRAMIYHRADYMVELQQE